MRTLILGGTRFLGRHIAEACLARGHEVTLFHRGLSGAAAFPEVEHLIGDRDAEPGVEALRGRTWDAVFDTSGYEVAPVRKAAEAVAHDGLHYAYVSSVSVYDASPGATSIDESAPVKSVPDPERAALSLEAYGGLKAACEAAAQQVLPGRVQCVRAGILLGPHDNDERFAYWLRRIARGGEVLAPGDPNALVQFIDVRDLARWMVASAEKRVTGVFNATGPGETTTMRRLLETIREVTASEATFTWVPSSLLVSRGVAPYSEMPFWLPPPYDAWRFDATRAVAAGLGYRPVFETVRDAWAWLRAGWDAAASARAHRRLTIPAGITPEREASLLAEAHRLGADA